MARKATVNKETVLSMLKEGETTQHIAEKFNVSRQAIDLYRKDFIARGLLPDRRASRVSKSPKEASPREKIPESPPQSPLSPDTVPSLDEQIDLIISAFDALKRLPQLEKELETYRRENENARLEIERLKGKVQKRLDQENRWLLTQNQDDENSPGNS
jgi:hypothetical protein